MLISHIFSIFVCIYNIDKVSTIEHTLAVIV